ncbi:MAG: RNase adapter RapZ [Actinobacteria bacterium]|nr:RNase adapter RapZ [Actinomycetota bacterium]
MNEILVVAGMSGAGRSTVSAALEDAAWSVIDNLPLELITRVSELASPGGAESTGLAFIVGRSGGLDPEHLLRTIAELRQQGFAARLLFLDAPDDVLVSRFEGNRRRHPVSASSVVNAIQGERNLLRPLMESADLNIDTGALNTNQLRRRIAELFNSIPSGSMRINIMSFGYSNGIPRDADVVMDCRFLPNPHWVEELRAHTGLESEVSEYVVSHADAQRFLTDVVGMLNWQIPVFAKEGKTYFSIAFGCTGGKHRSVAIAEEIATRLGGGVTVFHRDVERS